VPLYEYECRACGDVSELMQKISDPAPETCPVCGKGPMAKLVSRSAFILKGGGWYVTDFRDKGKKPDAKKSDGEAGGAASDAGAPAAKAEGTGTADKAESKPAASPSADKPASSGGSTPSST
jgi:putative FmdB family regulatory protein